MEYLLYAECALILAALLTAGIGGVTILQRRPDAAGKLMGWAALVLGIGEALYLIPRAGEGLGFWAGTGGPGGPDGRRHRGVGLLHPAVAAVGEGL